MPNGEYLSPAKTSHDLEVTCTDGPITVSKQLWAAHCGFFEGMESFQRLSGQAAEPTNVTPCAADDQVQVAEDCNGEDVTDDHANKRRKDTFTLDLSAAQASRRPL